MSDNSAPASAPGARTVFGFTVHPGTLDDYVSLARNSALHGSRCTVLYHNLHSLYLWFRSPDLREHYVGSTVLVDGMPVIALLRAGGVTATRQQRVTYVDLIMPLLEMARDNSLKVYHVGQSADVQHRAFERIRAELPGIDISGHDGFFDQSPDAPDSLEVIRTMNDNGSALVLIGFGTPRQEAWLYAFRDRIEAPAVFACGACMEYVAGVVATPPRWMGRYGLEWAFRLGENPQRFAFRYLIEPVVLCACLARATLAGQRLATADSLHDASVRNGVTDRSGDPPGGSGQA